MTIGAASYTDVFIKKIANDIPMDVIFCGGIVGAFNGLHADEFTMHGHPIDNLTDYNRYQFLRRRHSAVRTGKATSIFIPINDEMVKRWANAAKQFAVYITNAEDVTELIVAPAEFINGVDETVDEVNIISNPYAEATIQDDDEDQEMLFVWLLRHTFTTPEMWFLDNDLCRDLFVNLSL